MGQILGYYEGSVEEFVADGLDQSTPSGDITFILGNGDEGDGFCTQNKVFKCGGDSPYKIYYISTDGNVVTPDTTYCRYGIKSNIYENGIGVITCKKPITSIWEAAFLGRTTLETIILPSTITSIDESAFQSCTSLRMINLAKSVTQIGPYAFAYTALTTLKIPETVSSIGDYAFSSCNISEMRFEPLTPPTLGNNVFNTTNIGKIYVPTVSFDDYTNASSWSSYVGKVVALLDNKSLITINGQSLVGNTNMSLGTYSKPNGGIPKSDLDSNVQNSLSKADTALQEVKTINGLSIVGSGNINITTDSGGSGLRYLEPETDVTAINIPSNTLCNWSPSTGTLALNVALNTDEADYGTIELLLRIGETQPDFIKFHDTIYWKDGKQPILDANKVFRFNFSWGSNKAIVGSWEAYPLYIRQKEVINLHVMTINAKTEYGDWASPTQQEWQERKEGFLGFIRGYSTNHDGYTAPRCDIIGLQEVSVYSNGSQLSNITEFLEDDDYSLVIAARGNTNSLIQDSEACIIAYRKNKFTRVSGGYFWLRGGGWNGDTGDFNQEGYSYWDKTYQDNGTYEIKKRIAVWVILRENTTGKEIFVINTHYNQYFNEDNVAMSTPYYSSEIVKNRIDALSGGRPVIFMGDLHCNPDKSAISILKPTYYKLHDTRDRADEVLGMKYTMNSWQDEELSPTYALFDYIFTTDDFKVQSHITANAMVNGNYISDHNPVIVDLSLEV